MTQRLNLSRLPRWPNPHAKWYQNVPSSLISGDDVLESVPAVGHPETQKRGIIFMIGHETRRCHHTDDSGTPCKAHPLEGRKHCFFHDPAMKKKRAAAGRHGGLMRGQRALVGLKLPVDMFTGPLETPDHVAALLREAIARFCRGEIDACLADTVTYMANSLLHAWKETSRESSQEDERPAIQSSAMDNIEEEWADGPGTTEATIDLLQRTIAEARAMQAELEAGGE
jgi:hypothetical protein